VFFLPRRQRASLSVFCRQGRAKWGSLERSFQGRVI
jgi:hypothetical protein